MFEYQYRTEEDIDGTRLGMMIQIVDNSLLSAQLFLERKKPLQVWHFKAGLYKLSIAY